MTIAFFEVKENWEREEIVKTFGKRNIKIFEDTLQETINKGVDLSSVEIISIFIYSKCDKNNLAETKKVKMISTRSTGYDHIDLEYCRTKKITVTNVPTYGEHTVAEFTMGLLLTITRKIPQSVDRTRSGLFDFSGLRGVDLFGKTIGIIGVGKIGRNFAKMCKAFGMNVIVYDINQKFGKAVAKDLDVEYDSLDNILSKADILSLHLPSTPKTKHFFNKKAFDKMKDGVIILNTARGDIIDSKALLQALVTGKVGHAGLDVIEGEMLIKDEIELLHKEGNNKSRNYALMLHDHIIMTHPNVTLTPHNAFNTIDALLRILNTSNDNIKNFKSKKLEQNIIN